MTLYVNKPASNATVTVNSIPNVIGGPSGMGEENLLLGDTDDGIYKINSPWYVNLNGQLTNEIYVSTNSFMSFGTPSIFGDAPSNKIFLGKTTGFPDVYVKNFYSVVSGSAGNRTLRMRYEGSYEKNPSINSFKIPSVTLGAQSLETIPFSSSTSASTSYTYRIPWNFNIGASTGTIQNAVKVYKRGFFEFGKEIIVNGNPVFQLNQSSLQIYYYALNPYVGTSHAGGVEGTFPNRTFRIRYEGSRASGDNRTGIWELIFYENDPDTFDIQIETGYENTLSSDSYSSGLYTVGLGYVAALTKKDSAFPQEVGTRITQNKPGYYWTLRTSPWERLSNDMYIWSLKEGNNLFFASGGNVSTGKTGQIGTSTNGIVWSITNPPLFANGQITEIGYGNNLYIASSNSSGMGNHTVIATSIDTITWTQRNLPASFYSYLFSQIYEYAYGNGVHVGVGWASNEKVMLIMTSPDGITWTARNSGISGPLYDIVFGNGQFVASGLSTSNYIDTSLLLTSVDGVTWSIRTTPGSSVSGYGTATYGSLSYANNLFFLGSSGSSKNLMVSTDAIIWQFRTVSNGNVAYDNVNNYYVATHGSFISFSTDTIVWQQQNTIFESSYISNINNVFVSNSRFSSTIGASKVDSFATGQYITPSQVSDTFEWESTLYENNTNRIDVQLGSNPSLKYPYTITEWTLRTSSGSLVKQLAYGFGGYLASSGGTLLHSTDAISWRARTAPIVSGYLYTDIVAGNNLYLASAVGSGDNAAQLMSSTDTIHWSVRTMWKETPQFYTVFEVLSVYLSYDKFNDRYLIVKNYQEVQAPNSTLVTSTIAVSTNGIQWSLRTNRFSFDDYTASGIVTGIDANFGQGGTVLYVNYRGFVLQASTNTIVWTVRTMPHFLNGLNYVDLNKQWYYTRNLSFFSSEPTLYRNNFDTVISPTWQAVPLPTDGLVQSQVIRPDASTIISGTTPNNENLYIMGTNIGRAIFYSTDAISWSVRTCSTSTLINNVPVVSDMTYNPNTYRFAAIGSPITNVYGILTANIEFDPIPLIPFGYDYGVNSVSSSLYKFPIIANAGYSILSTYSTPTWATVQNLYAKITPSALASAWQRVKNLYVRDSGFWKLVHPNTTGPVYFFCKRSTYENDTYGNKGGTGIAAFQNDTFIVPDGVTSITVELWGGGGSAGAGCNNSYPGDGGGGGYVKASLSVTPGETLTVRVGGGGWQYAANQLQHPDTPAGGPATINVVSRRSDVNLADQSSLGAIAGSGGGYSAIFRGLTPLLVAGGGGGGGSGTYDGLIARGGDGGPGGGLTGGSGVGGSAKVSTGAQLSGGGGGGTQLSGGIGGVSGISPRQGCTLAPSGENGASLQGGRGVNSPPTQGNNLITYGTASNPGTNGGAAGGGSSRTGATVCNDGNGAFSGSPIDSTAYSNSSLVLFWGTGSPVAWYDTIPLLPNTVYTSFMCGGGGGGGYYGGGGGGAGYGAYLIDLASAAPRPMLDSHSCGGGGGGGGSNYVGGAASVISNSRGSGRVPGNTTSPYYITNYLYPPSGNVPGVPFNAFAQGGAGHGGVRGALGSPNNTIRYGTRGENGLVVIYW